MAASSREATYRLTPMQEGMLLNHLADPRGGDEVAHFSFRFDAPIDADAMTAAWQALAARYEPLRTGFRWADVDRPVQFVADHAEVPVTVGPLPDDLDAFFTRERIAGFDPAAPPMCRIGLFDVDTSPVMVWTVWHIILDGRSLAMLLADLFRGYEAAAAGDDPHAAIDTPAPPPFQTFVEWLDGLDPAPLEAFWREEMAGYEGAPELAIETVRGERAGRHGEARHLLTVDERDAVAELAQRADATVGTVVQAAWSIVLGRYGRTDDVVFGTTRMGRHGTVERSLEMVGIFLTTIPMRTSVAGDRTLRELLAALRQSSLDHRAHEHAAPTDIQEWSDVPAGKPLFESVCVYESFQLDPNLKRATGRDDVFFELDEQSPSPLLLSVYDGEQLDLRLEYQGTRYPAAAVDTMLGHVAHVLRVAPALLDEPLSVLELTDAADLARLEAWGSGPDRPVAAPLIPSRIAAVAAATPDEPAIIDGDQTTTFAELDGIADSIASCLQAAGVRPGDRIVALLERSPAAIAAMVGAMRVGAAYVPVDPAAPPARIAALIGDASPVAAIASEVHAAAAAAVDGPVVVVDAPIDPASPVPVKLTADDAAYVIYTSGSTGTPKGVVVPHGALLNHAVAVGEVLELTNADRVLQFAALTFDVAGEEIFPTLLAGASVVLRTPEVATDLAAFDRLLADRGVTVANLPAAYWAEWVDHLGRTATAVPASLRVLVAGSDRVSPARLREWNALVGPGVRWLNGYGPTEATITASFYESDGHDDPSASVPIGRPIANVQFRVVDPHGNPCPAGVPGELLIGGAGVALGYLDRPDLTEAVFRSDAAGLRWYATGDLARFLDDGQVEFLGRADHQVKVRGYRIELEEIENVLERHEAVSNAVVVAVPDAAGNNQLYAHYVVADGAATPADAEIVDYLAAALPTYMVPVAAQPIDSIPTTAGGKVDRRAIAGIDVVVESDEFVEPATDTERAVAEAYAKTLGASQVGATDHFFHLGGNSLLAIRLLADLERRTGVGLRPPELFTTPTVTDLAALIDRRISGDHDTDGLPNWVVPLKPVGTKTPLWHLGGVAELYDMADRIDPARPVYGVLEQDLDRSAPLHTHIDEIVPHCIAGIRTVQPSGPYLLAGFCFGGIVALEIARSLRAQGEQVDLVMMVDSFAPGAFDVDQRRLERITSDEAGRRSLVAFVAKVKPAKLWRVTRFKLRRKYWARVHEALRARGRQMPRFWRNVNEANFVASDRYVARTYEGDVALVRCVDGMAARVVASNNGWDPHVGGTIRTHDIDAPHTNVYREPYVGDIAGAFDLVLADVGH